jgi:DinB family protein
MTIGQNLLPEFDQEMGATRRLLERVPGDKIQWKPHPKSFALGHLTQLVSWIPGWITQTLQSPALDLAGGGARYGFENPTNLLDGFDKNVLGAREALGSVTDAGFALPWSLKMGDRVLLTLPRAAAVRNHISHLVHHRGQLTVYLRLLDVPLPPIYGPTADEKPW